MIAEIGCPELEADMILNALAKKSKRQLKDDFKGHHFGAWLIVRAVRWYAISVQLPRY